MNTYRLSGLLALTLLLGGARADVPFPGSGGNYGGIIEASSSGDPNNSGILIVVMGDSGAASISLVWQGQTYKLKGAFTGDSTNGQFTKDLVKKAPQTEGTNLTLICNLDPSSRTITGVVSDPEASSGGGFSLDGNVAEPSLAAQLDPGLRMAFIDDPVAPAAPEDPQRASAVPPATGTGFAVVTLGKSLRTKTNHTVGHLSDDQPYMAGSPLRGASYALRSGLYSHGRGKAPGGQVLGNGDVNAGSGAPSENGAVAPRSLAGLIAALRWHKNPDLSASAYRGGFDGRVSLDTIPYTRSGDVRFVLTGAHSNFFNASLILSGANFPNNIVVKMNLTIFGAIIAGANPNGVRISVQPSAAKFHGSFRPDPASRERIFFHGALRSSTGVQPNVVPGEGKGSFLRLDRNDPDNSVSGKVSIKTN